MSPEGTSKCMLGDTQTYFLNRIKKAYHSEKLYSPTIYIPFAIRDYMQAGLVKMGMVS